MVKINTSKKFVDLKGEEIEVADNFNNYGKYMAEAVLAHKVEGSMRKLALAQKLYNAKDSINIESPDLVFIKNAIKEAKLFVNEGYNTMFNGQIEMYLESLKEKEDK